MSTISNPSVRNPIVWETAQDRLVLSARDGGRIISWKHAGLELVREPQVLEGGLLRIMLAEERYPGASYCSAHQIVSCGQDHGRFRAHLRHYWHAPNLFARLFGWPDKDCPRYLDGLLLDKVVIFDPATTALLVDVTITNLNAEVREITPWVQNCFCEWIDHGFVVKDGERAEYRPDGGWWYGHPVDRAASVRLVQANRRDDQYVVLGAAAQPLGGFMKYDPADYGPAGREAMGELRYKPVSLPAHSAWHANFFTALTNDWRRWASAAPVELHSGIPEHTDKSGWQPTTLLPTLEGWALPEETERGFMVLSYLDKIPFTSASRFAAAHAIAGFHAEHGRGRATVAILAMQDLPNLRAEISGTADWTLIGEDGRRAPTLTLPMTRHSLAILTIDAPVDLRGKEAVVLRLTTTTGAPVTLSVPRDAATTPRYPYQFKQMATYLEERYHNEKGGFTGTTAAEFRAWQAALRRRHIKWLYDNSSGECPIEPRLLERQTGPTCIRDKIAIQTEPGMWLPSFVVYPRNAPPKMPAIMLIHGSGPGKENYAPDEAPENFPPPAVHELYFMPYRLAQQLNCLVYVPDQRSQGEWGESYSQKAAQRTGYNPWALRAWDHIRSVSYLCSRPNVDAAHIGCMGASGGGSATMFTAGIDERVSAAILSSMPPFLIDMPDQYFRRLWSDGSELDTGWCPLTETPAATALVCALTIPRALWITDGTHDECWGDPKAPEAEEVFAKARARWQPARDEIERLYRIAGAADKFKATWFPGEGHCAGMTVVNVVDWFRKWGFQG